ncbi:hypothetical protein A7589_11005, partial [Escherichia sp. MOD1-EC6475]|uniref:IS1 family transposase n=1 Tax=Escherichia sp. MOD1-EC6475 TaxID=2162662 RepID=UPI000D4C989F
GGRGEGRRGGRRGREAERGERDKLGRRQQVARLGRESVWCSKSVELHDKVVGQYLNIKREQ